MLQAEGEEMNPTEIKCVPCGGVQTVYSCRAGKSLAVGIPVECPVKHECRRHAHAILKAIGRDIVESAFDNFQNTMIKNISETMDIPEEFFKDLSEEKRNPVELAGERVTPLPESKYLEGVAEGMFPPILSDDEQERILERHRNHVIAKDIECSIDGMKVDLNLPYYDYFGTDKMKDVPYSSSREVARELKKFYSGRLSTPWGQATSGAIDPREYAQSNLGFDKISEFPLHPYQIEAMETIREAKRISFKWPRKVPLPILLDEIYRRIVLGRRLAYAKNMFVETLLKKRGVRITSKLVSDLLYEIETQYNQTGETT
jgi:hypothetical protein